jgi:HlyD family secretion protein
MKSFLSVLRTPPSREANREVRIFQSETAEILAGPEPVQARITLFVLLGMFVCMTLIALTMRVDRVVTSTAGQMVTIEPTIVLGALDQSIIKALNVHEGQTVKQGELLATLDPTFTTADVGALKSQVANLNAQIARCQAEIAQKPFDMPPTADTTTNTFIAMQRDYYTQRKAQYDAQVRSYNEQIAQYKATMAKYQADAARYGDRAKISQEIENMRATLAAAQVGSRLNLLTATDQKLEIQRSLDFDRNAMTESQHQIDSTAATRDAYIQQWYAQTSQELVKAQSDRDTAAEQLTKATMHMNLVTLEAELHVAARDIGFIRAGDETTVKLDPFNFIEHGTASGKVRSISEGAFTVDDNGQPAEPYYKVRVALDPVELRNMPAGYRLVPGMTLTGDIHVGTRSLFTYLVGGVMRGLGESMREP